MTDVIEVTVPGPIEIITVGIQGPAGPAGAAGTTPSLPSTEIGIGTGTAISSSPHLSYNAATGLLKQLDTGGDAFLEAKAITASNRYFRITDETQNSIFNINARAAGRQISIDDSDGGYLFEFDTKAGGRTLYIANAAGQIVFYVDGKTGQGAQFASVAAATLVTTSNGAGPYFITSVCVGLEPTGNGTGAPCVYKSAGPDGAGWYSLFSGTKATE